MGLRRRGSGLNARVAISFALAAGLAAGVGQGCVGLSDEDTNVLSLHLENSTMFFQQGSYLQSMHQADMALSLDDDHVGMRIIKGFCLTKLSTIQGTVSGLDEAIELFDDLKHGAGEEDYRTWLGSAEARLSRALRNRQQGEVIQRRLESDFLSEEGREAESEQLELEQEDQARNLSVAEFDLRRVLRFPLHADNTYALMDLIVVLNMDTARQDESVSVAKRTIDLLVEGIELTRETLNDFIRLSPTKKVSLQQRVETSLDKEQQLRQIIVAIEFERGSYQRCLDELAALEERQLMAFSDHQLRAEIYESIGMLPDALDELQVYLRLRARTYEFDDVARDTLQRIDELRARIAAAP
jgi:hypothetical protein